MASSSGSSASVYAEARHLVDDVHRRDPLYVAHARGATRLDDSTEGEDKQDELAYADAMESWVDRLIDRAGAEAEGRLAALPGGKDLVQLAARCQHLERFATPRSTFPEGKAGYLQWRRSLYHTQADHAVKLMQQAGMQDEECQLVRKWVSKTDLRPGRYGGEWGTQLLEDAAVLVFLENQLQDFTKAHADYSREKHIDILKKTSRKLSDEGKEAVKTIQMPDHLRDIAEEAMGIT